MKRTPTGFYVCGLCSAILGVLLAVGLWSMEAGNHVEAEEILVRGVLAVLAALSAVATEALWRARPWAWRASVALAVAWGVTVMAMSFTESDEMIAPGTVLVL
ncbi:MAG TPA: hypothetical protein VFJ16_21180, partial [Longimicrobium sp.]|nr:hypothetical protein [Longimicrobium sp.]